MRAIETGRWVAQVAPTGFTAVIDDAGNVIERSAISERRVIQRTVELRDGLTIYVRWGNAAGLLLASMCIAAGWAIELRTRRSAGEEPALRSEEHTSELQSLMRISYAVFCLKKKNTDNKTHNRQN